MRRNRLAPAFRDPLADPRLYGGYFAAKSFHGAKVSLVQRDIKSGELSLAPKKALPRCITRSAWRVRGPRSPRFGRKVLKLAWDRGAPLYPLP